jgi:hypothetical protein
LFGAIYSEHFIGNRLSSAYHSPLLDIGLSNASPSRSIFGYSHPAPASRPAQTVTPPGLRASYTTFTETRSPLQDLFIPAVVGSTADMASPLPLQHGNTVRYVGDFSSLSSETVHTERKCSRTCLRSCPRTCSCVMFANMYKCGRSLRMFVYLI